LLRRKKPFLWKESKNASKFQIQRKITNERERERRRRRERRERKMESL
jgi:hypothetical protein